MADLITKNLGDRAGNFKCMIEVLDPYRKFSGKVYVQGTIVLNAKQ